MSSLNDPENVHKALDAQVFDPLTDMSIKIIEFLKTHLTRIGEQYELRKLVDTKIRTHIEADAYSPQDLIALYRMLSGEALDSAKSILDIMRPAPGVESPLTRAFVTRAENNNSGSNDKFDLSNMTPQQIRGLNDFINDLALASKPKGG